MFMKKNNIKPTYFLIISIIFFSIISAIIIESCINSKYRLIIISNINFLDNILSLISILFGFFGTTLAIMLNNENNILLKTIRNNKAIKNEFITVLSIIVGSALAIIILIIITQILNVLEQKYLLSFSLLSALLIIFFGNLILFFYVFITTITNTESKNKMPQRTMGKKTD